jgi:type IV pilus assembly protein PilB
MFRGRGCDTCNNTGYKGRVGIFELMIMNDELREMVMRNSSNDDLRKAAKANGMLPLREGGYQFIFDGLTSPEEVIRETVVES